MLSGYSLGEADLLRRAMGKKIKEEMAKQRVRFVKGAVENKVDKGQAEYIFELVDKFAGYAGSISLTLPLMRLWLIIPLI